MYPTKDQNTLVRFQMNTSKILSVLGVIGVGALAMSPMGAQAVELQAVLSKAQTQLASVADIISGGAYIIGAGTGVMSLLKFKEHNDNPQQVKLSKPLTLLLVSGGLLSLPSFLTIGGDSAGLDEANELKSGVLR